MAKFPVFTIWLITSVSCYTDVDWINEVYKLRGLYTILQTLYKVVFKDSALHLRAYQRCPKCEFGETFAFRKIHSHPSPHPTCVIFLTYLVFEEIEFCAGAAFMGQGIGDDQMSHFKVRDWNQPSDCSQLEYIYIYILPRMKKTDFW